VTRATTAEVVTPTELHLSRPMVELVLLDNTAPQELLTRESANLVTLALMLQQVRAQELLVPQDTIAR